MNPDLAGLTVHASREGRGWYVGLFRGGALIDFVHTKLSPRVAQVGRKRKETARANLVTRRGLHPGDAAHYDQRIAELDAAPLAEYETIRIYRTGSRPAVMTPVWNRSTEGVELLGCVEVSS